MADQEQRERFKKEINMILRVDKNFARMLLSIGILSAVAFGLTYLKASASFLPDFVTVDFSVFAELLAAIAYGPVIGVIVGLIKSVLLVFTTPYSLFSVVSNFFINSAFIVVASVYYFRIVFPSNKPRKKDSGEVHRRKTIFIGCLLGMIPASIIQFFTTLKFVFPKFNWYYGKYGYKTEDLMTFYQKSTEKIASVIPLYPQPKTLWGNVLLINIPVTLFKFLIVSLLVMWLYPKLSPYMHFRKTGK